MKLQEHVYAPRTSGIFHSKTGKRSSSSPLLLTLVLFLAFGARMTFAQAPPAPDENMDQPYSAAPGSGQQGSGQQPAYPQAQGNQPPGDDSGQAQLLQPYVEQQEGSSGQVWPQQAYQPAQALDATQLEQLVAPIALYPDSLVAVILAASTYPDQIAQAAQWRQAQGDASADQIAAAADLQNWDASVKALTAFPQVLSNLDANMQWTVALGNAYYNQSQDVLWAVQRMRYRAQEAGNLESTPQQVVGEDQGSMQIVPENPQVVYVPMYNPWVVYGAPIAPYPGFSLFGAIGSVINSVVSFGVGMVMTPFFHVGWGCTGWGLNWASQSVLFHHSIYYSRSRSVADWGLPHGGPRAFAAARSTAYAPPRYGMAGGGGGYGTQSSQAFAGTQRGYGEGSNRAYAGPSPGYNRQPLEAYNRAPQTYSRPGLPATPYSASPHYSSPAYSNRPGSLYGAQPYNRSAVPAYRSQPYVGQSYTNRYSNPRYSNPGTAYGGRPYGGMPYAGSQAYRAPSGFQRAYGGNAFAGYSGKSPNSGGFHPFGGSHNSPNYGGQMKSFGGGKSFGGHSGGFHSFGGGSHGGHFGGGHGGGGGHHRL